MFITENKTNGLAFPDHPASLVIFGLGYGLDRLTADEQQLYAELRDDHHGERVRLEQERIAYGRLLRALATLDVS